MHTHFTQWTSALHPLQQPESAWRLEACYRWLEPLIAPLEPLLLAAGVERQHDQRHCLCGERSLSAGLGNLCLQPSLARSWSGRMCIGTAEHC